MWMVGNGVPGVAYFEQVLKVLIEETFGFSFCSSNWPTVDCKVCTFFSVLYSFFSRGMLCDFNARIVSQMRIYDDDLNYDENLFEKICILGKW